MDTGKLYAVNTKKFLASELGTEMILMNLSTGDYIGLNEVSAEIWKAAANGATAEEIIKYLLQQYDVAADECKAQTEDCIQEMVEKELLIEK